MHGQEEAQKAQETAQALFEAGGVSGDMPTMSVSGELVSDGVPVLELLTVAGITPSKAEARRLVTQGGITANEQKIQSIDHSFTKDDFGVDGLIIKKGKKNYYKVVIQ